MAHLDMNHDEFKALLYQIPILRDHETLRHQIADIGMHLSDADDWYPDALRRSLRNLESSGLLTETNRHLIERALFPEHDWNS